MQKINNFGRIDRSIFSSSPKKKKRKLVKVLIFCAYILAILILMEIFLRIFYPQPVFKRTILDAYPAVFNESSYLPWQLKPNAESRHTSVIDEWNVDVKINSLGYRDNEFNITKGENEKRILVLGDSFTFGFGVENNESYPKILEKMLKENGFSNYSVINAGYKDAYSIDTEYLYFKKEGLLLKPDIVVLGFVGDDVERYRIYGHNYTFDKNGSLIGISSSIDFIDNESRLVQIDFQNSSWLKRTAYNLNVFLSYNSDLYILFKDTFRQELNKIYSGTPGESIYSQNYSNQTEKDVELSLNYLSQINDLAKSNNATFIIFIVPSKEEVENVKIKDNEGNLMNWTKPNDIIKDFGKKEGIIVIDPSDQFEKASKQNGSLYFQVDPHWNRKGQYVAGVTLYNEMLNMSLFLKG